MNRKLFLFASLGISALGAANAQSGYTIHGDIKGLNEPYVYLAQAVADSFRIDSAAVTNGAFTFTGSVSEPTQGQIFNKERSKGFSLYIENSKINVTGNYDSLQNVTVTGSATQNDANELKNSSVALNKQEQEIYGKYQEAAGSHDSVAQKKYAGQLDSLDNINTENLKSFVKSHPKSFMSISLLSQMTYSSSFTDLNSMYSALDPSIKNSTKGKKFAEHLALMEKTQDGKPAIPFTQNDTTGKPVNLTDFKGKYVLVDFWASWCGPCRAENPNVVKAFNKYKDKNFTVLGVSLDQSADKWKDAIVKDNLTWTEISDLKYWKNDAAAKYGVQAIPANFLIDPNGVIVGHNLRGEDLENKLAALLK